MLTRIFAHLENNGPKYLIAGVVFFLFVGVAFYALAGVGSYLTFGGIR